MDAHRPSRRRVAAGAAIIVALVAAATLIVLLDRIQQAVEGTYEIVAVFPAAEDLRSGTEVRVAGRPMGAVRQITGLPATGDTLANVAAVLELEDDVRPLVRRDSEVRLVRATVLGRTVVDITPGTSAAPVLAAGDTLYARPGLTPEDVLAEAEDAAAAWNALTASATTLRRSAQATLEGPAVRTMLAEFDRARAEFRRLEEAYPGGSLDRLIHDPSWRTRMARVRRAAATLQQELTERLTELQAAEVRQEAAQLRASLRRTRRHARELAAQLDRLEARLRAPRGLPGRLALDTALAAALRAVRAQLDSLLAAPPLPLPF